MAKKRWSTWLLTAGLLWAGMAAAPPSQEATPTPSLPTLPPVWVSPTPDETGAITVIVQSGESMWVIAARAGLALPELLALNNLTESSIINPGDVLLIGHGTPGTVLSLGGTAVTTPAPTRPPPTPRPTVTQSEATICLTAFDDLNRDGTRDPDEPLRAGVAFTIFTDEAVVANHITDPSGSGCLRLPPGEYRVTRSALSGEVLTTAGDWALSLAAGGELHQAFGSFIGEAEATPTADGGPTTAAIQTPAPTVPGFPAPPPPSPPAPRLSLDGPFAVRLAGVIALFLCGLLLLGAVLILLFKGARDRTVGAGSNGSPLTQSAPTTGERSSRDSDQSE